MSKTGGLPTSAKLWWVSQKESAVAPKKSEDATIEDLEQIFKKHGHKPQIALGLAVAARNVWSPIWKERIEFLLTLLEQNYYPDRADLEYEVPLAGEIRAEVVSQLVEIPGAAEWICGDQLQRLVDFLGRHPPLEGVRGKVKTFLATFNRFKVQRLTSVPLDWESLTQALLRYQMFDELGLLVKNRIYDAIPALLEAVVEQVGERSFALVYNLVIDGWENEHCVAVAFQKVGDDSRALKFLLNLAQAYIDEHGESYPIDDPRAFV